jgi:hypothetical protein
MGTIAVAGFDLDRLRAAPLYEKLPSGAVALGETYHSAHRLLLAWNGSDLLIVIRGSGPGATAVAPDLAVTGSPASVRAAVAQYHTGKSGAPRLTDFAAKSVASSPVWAAVQGGVHLDLPGNARNLNRLLLDLDYAALALNLDSALDLEITAQARSDPASSEFERNLRAILTLASAAEARNPRIASLFDSMQIRRTGLTTTANLRIPEDAVSPLLDQLRQ